VHFIRCIKPNETKRHSLVDSDRNSTLNRVFLSFYNYYLLIRIRVQVHFIRCIKPNEAKQPSLVDAQCVAKQVDSSGLVPAIGISRAGFSTHMPRADFAALFGPPWERTTGGKLAHPLDDAQVHIYIYIYIYIYICIYIYI